MKPSEPNSESLRYYQSIEFLPIGCFRKIVETGDLRYLLKLEDYEYLPDCSLNLLEIWEKINSEYMQFSKGQRKKMEVAFTLEKEITRLKIDYWIAQGLIYAIGIDKKGRADHIKDLAEIGYSIEYTDERDLIEKLKAAQNWSRGMITQRKIREAELKRLTKEEEGGGTFEELVDAVEVYKGYKIDIWTTSTKQWLTMVNNYEKYIKEMKKHGRSRKDK
jgi:hypothetical protein